MANLDRIKSHIAATIVALVGNRLDYLALYPARVVVQHGDGTLDVIPDDTRIPSVSNLRIRYGIPGVTATVLPGARVLLGWASGDPQKPIATIWESATVSQLNINATSIVLNSGTFPIARALSTDSAGPWPIVGGNVTVKG